MAERTAEGTSEASDGASEGASLGLRFWWRTFEGVRELFAEGHGEEGGTGDPLPVKTYRGLPRHVLPAPARRIGDARWSFPGFRRARPGGGPRCDVLDEASLSALLGHGYGLSRVELGPHAVWPYHRTVASARCFHPVELYVWTAAPAGPVPAGCYHYDPAHHSLTRLRDGGIPAALREAVGGGPVRPHALVVAAVDFRKSAFRYRDYAYRLASQEAGMTVGNVLLAAGALGLRGRVHHRFDDAVVNRALGLDGAEEESGEGVEETAFAVLELLPAGGPGAPPVPAGPEARGALDRVRPQRLRTHTGDASSWAGLTAVDRAARQAVDRGPVEPMDFHAPEDSGDELTWDHIPSGETELASALRVRDSGGRMFLPADAPLPCADLAALLRHALEPVESDHTGGAGAPLVDCHVLALRVTGVPAGLYRLNNDGGALTALPGRDWRPVVDMLCDRTPAVNSAKAPALVFLGVDRFAGDRWFGDRGYRILHQEAGIVAQRISVLAAAAGVSARVTNGYHADLVRELTGGGPGRVPVFTLVLGRRRPSAQYEPPLTW
ncbi:SagB family peptide dehydrogenase [Streptomyces sp. NPDC021093]|uniref:SagB family peptide dehydrogenase n=1 Tax=Streptomyces sp. NPDC021093 TaxID=3365112 RepID=UPI0037A33E9E